MLNNAFAVGLRTLAANPLRTFLSTLGVIIGTAALVAVLAVGDGVEQFAREQIATSTDLQLFSVSPVLSRHLDGLTLPRADTVALEPGDLAALRAAVGGGIQVDLSRSGGSLVGGIAGEPRAARIDARVGDLFLLSDSALWAGRWLDPAEMRGSDPVTVISPALATLIAPDGEVLGRQVQFGSTSFAIVGVAQLTNDSTALRAMVPFEAFDQATNGEPVPAVMLASMPTLESMPAAVERARAWAETRGGDGLEVRNRADRLEQVGQGMSLFKLMMGSITGISLLVGGIGIMNVLLAGVVERTREIGIRRATGALRRDIVSQFLAESLVITGAGSLAGLVLGFGIASGVAAVMRLQLGAGVHAVFTALPIMVAATSAVIIGLTFGLYPALKAGRLSPTEAMRTE